MRNLGVFVDSVLVATLHDTEPLSLTYTQDCLGGLVRAPFSAIIPLVPGQISTTAVMSFFENLLPEGEERSLLEARHRVTTIFGLLSKVGGDTAGAVVVLPEGQYPQPDDYLPVSWQDIAMILNHTADATPAIAATVGSNVSLSGAQHKLLLLIGADGAPSLPLNASISTHILKPDIARTDLKVFSSAINETLIMKLANACRLPTASVEYLPAMQSCLIERFDRAKDDGGNLMRLYQADLCQLLDKPSGVKYESDGGPSFKDCYKLIRERSAVPLTDCQNLLRWLFFNLVAGNNDSHAKNLSMLFIDGKSRLAPFYDLMCTQVYSGLSGDFALRLGQQAAPGKIGLQAVCDLADSLAINRRILLAIALDMTSAIENELPKVMETLLPLISNGSSERVLLNRVSTTIRSNIKKFRTRLLPTAPQSASRKQSD